MLKEDHKKPIQVTIPLIKRSNAMTLRMSAMIAAGALLALTSAGASQAIAESGTTQTDKSKQPAQQSGKKPSSSGTERSSGQKSDVPKASGGNLGEDKTSTSGSTAPPKGNTGGAPGPSDGSRGGH